MFLVACRARVYPDFSTTGFTGSTQDAAFFRVLSKGMGLSSRVCMSTFCYRIALLYIMFPFEKKSSAEIYPNGRNAESFLGALRMQRNACSLRKRHQTRRPIAVAIISEKLSLNNGNALMGLNYLHWLLFPCK